jgi:hypothetical protein
LWLGLNENLYFASEMRGLGPVLREGCDFSRKNPLIFAPPSVSEAVYGNLRG